MQLHHRFAQKIAARIPAGLANRLIGGRDPEAKFLRRRRSDANLSLSMDAFDTLITRALANPSDLFVVAGYQLRAAGLIACSPDEWRLSRCEAERVARTAADDREVTLAEIYDALAARHHGLDVIKAQAIEIAIEKALIRPIAANAAFLSQMAKDVPTAIISDIYLPEQELRKMIAACGVELASTPVFASSTTGNTKASGQLFEIAKAIAQGRRRVHVGDNLFADVWRARHAGCIALPYLDAQMNRLERLLAATKIEPPILASALAGSARAARLRTSSGGTGGIDVGGVSSGFSGPMLLAFVVWILIRAKALKIEILYFLARDGEILFAIAKRIVDQCGLEIELRYLYVSRQALHLPALTGGVDENLSHFGLQAGQTLDLILSKFDLVGDARAQACLAANGFPISGTTPLSIEEVERLDALLRSDAGLVALIAEKASAHRHLLLDYLRQEDMLAPKQIGLVDIGWRGNLQRSICKVLATIEPNASHRVTGFYYGLYSRPPACGRLEAFIDQPAAAPLRPFVRGSMFEAVCAARHGTTIKYARGPNGQAVPVMASSENAEADAWGLAAQQEAICLFVDDVLAVLRQTGHDITDHAGSLTAASAAVTAAFVGRPTRLEAKTLGSFPHAADQAHDRFEELAPALPLSPMAWLRRYKRRASHPMISYWPEASIVRTMPKPIADVVLTSLAHLRATRERARAVTPSSSPEAAVETIPAS